MAEITDPAAGSNVYESADEQKNLEAAQRVLEITESRPFLIVGQHVNDCWENIRHYAQSAISSLELKRQAPASPKERKN